MSTTYWPDPRSVVCDVAARKVTQVATPHGTRRIEFNRKFQDKVYVAPREQKREGVCGACGEEAFACRCAYTGMDCAACGRGKWACACDFGV